MELPSLFRGESLSRLIQGAVFGVAATAFIGFNWGGWMLESTAEAKITKDSRSAVVSVLAPICADKFRQAEDMTENLAMLKKESSYQRASFVEKGGWAVLPGSDEAGSGVARACAKILVDLE